MKQFFTLCIFACLMFNAQVAQAALPDGATAEDWTLTDLNGNTHNLYSYLDAGIPVILEFSATWCPPCWSYHQTGRLKDMYNTYGPPGTGEIMVFYVEADLGTNTACLYGPSGCNDSTQGDWVTGTPYPIIDLTSATSYVKTDYQVTGYPTLYAISPDRRAWDVGQATISTWENWLFDSFSLTTTHTSVDADCNMPLGSIDLNPTGGYAGLNYTWSDGQTTQDVSVPEGTYDVRIRDANGYYIDQTGIVITSSSDPIETTLESLEDVSCLGFNNGSIFVSSTGGVGGYSYNWSHGASGALVTNLGPGTYTVDITDPAGCLDSETFTIEEPPLLFANSNSFPASCDLNNGLAIIFANGGTEPYQYDIGNGNTPLYNFPNLAPGNYIATVTDNNGCETYSPFIIGDIAAPTADAGNDEMLDCLNPEVSLVGSSTGDISAQKWVDVDGNVISNSADVVIAVPGTYYYEIVDVNGCQAFDEVIVTENSNLPNADAGTDQVIDCNSITLFLDGSQSSTGTDFEYSWTTTDGNIVNGADELEAEIDMPGTYILEVTNTSNGCVSSSSVEVNGDYATPSVSTNNAILTCDVSSVEICATTDMGSVIKWQTPGGEVIQDCIEVSAAGDYTAIAEASNGCTSEAIASVSQDINLPIVAIEAPTESLSCTILEVGLSGDVEGDINDFEITWTTMDGNIVSGADGLNPIVDQAGLYIMSVYAPASGCGATAEIAVETTAALPDAVFSSNLNDVELELTNQSSGDPNSFEWTLDGEVIGTGAAAYYSFVETGTYEVCFTAENACGMTTTCEDIQFISAMIGSGSSVGLTCYDSNDGTISVSISGGLPGYTYMWSGPNNFVSDQSELSGLEPGIYMVEAMDEAGNTYEDTFEVTAPQQISATADLVHANCFGDENGVVDLTASGGTGTLSYSWADGATGSIRNDLAAGFYSVEIKDENNCTESFDYIIEQPAPISGTTIQNDILCFGDLTGSISLEVEGGTGELSFEWEDGSTEMSRTDLGVGEYSCVVKDENGCDKTYDFVLTSPDALNLDDAVTQDENDGGANGSIDITISGGSAPYNYLWSDGSETQDLSGLSFGEYSCIVTDDNGCMFEVGPFVVNNITSDHLLAGIQEFQFFPNPVSQWLQVNMEFVNAVDLTIELFDINGQLIQVQKIIDQRVINQRLTTTDLEAGLHLLRISSDAGSMVRKISKL